MINPIFKNKNSKKKHHGDIWLRSKILHTVQINEVFNYKFYYYIGIFSDGWKKINLSILNQSLDFTCAKSSGL